MVRGFSEREKEVIRDLLIEKGKELFGIYGLKKTSIKDLTKAAGIAQGSFYKFFNSKEELYFEILQKEEEEIHQNLLGGVLTSNQITREAFQRLLQESFRIVDQNPIIRNLYSEEDYTILLRKLPEEKIKEHIMKDSSILIPLIEEWQRAGIMLKRDPEVIASLLRALFTITLHKKEIGLEIFDETMDLMIELVCNGLITEGEKKHD